MENNRWPKHVEGYTVYNTIYLHICICTCWFCLSHCDNSQVFPDNTDVWATEKINVYKVMVYPLLPSKI